MEDGLAERLQAAQRLHDAHRLAEAEAGYEAVLAEAPGHPVALAGLGTLLLQSGRNDRAAELLARAVAADPDRPNLHNNLGIALRRLGRREAAVAAYDRAIALRPGYGEAHNNRGNALLTLDRPAEALESLDRAVEIRPDSADWRRNRGLALLALDRLDDALMAFDEAVALSPDFAPGHFGRGTALARLDRLEEAVAALDTALALDPAYVSALNNRGEALSRLGRPHEALASFDAGLALAPDDSEIRDNRGLVLLALGRFAEGWPDYEHRWRVKSFLKTSSGDMTAAMRTRMTEDLEAGDLKGARVLVVAEQGVGDVIMFASLLPDLMAQAAQVTLRCEARLHRLFAASFPALALQDTTAPPPEPVAFDAILPIGGLARFYRNRREDFPGRPYLTAGEATRTRWAATLAPRTAPLRIGVSWKGGTATTRRERRSMPLADLRPILELPGVEAVSLQYGDPRAEVEAVNATLSRPIRLFEPQAIADFEDLAALVQGLDLVVSVQTAVVHLAGALGVRTMVMIPAVAEWRYGAAGAAMPWYAALELFRQGEDSAWEPVIARIAARLGVAA